MTNPRDDQELAACIPLALKPDGFNSSCVLPYDLTIEHLRQAMEEFLDFLGLINRQLHTREFPRLESFLMPASFSSLVGEFMNIRIPQHCSSLVKNQYHNGHPDLIPRGVFPNDAVQYAHEGIEIKGSRRAGGWQGHNPEPVTVTGSVAPLWYQDGPAQELLAGSSNSIPGIARCQWRNSQVLRQRQSWNPSP
jgi:hypothetical protein